MADLQIPLQKGLTALFLACSRGRREVVRWLADEMGVDCRREKSVVRHGRYLVMGRLVGLRRLLVFVVLV